MRYNVIPHFVPLDPSLYLAYPARTRGLDPMMLRKYIGYVPRYVYHVPEQLVPPTYTPHSVGNQFPTMV
jgi:hypothetical protein